jgi:hypothetical protein
MSLPVGASRLPLLAVTFGLRAWESTRKPREFALRRGLELVGIAAHTPLGRLLPAPVPLHAPQAEAEAVRIAADARRTVTATVSSAAPATPAETAAKVTEQLEIDEPKDRGDLPIADFDHITLGSLRARLRALSIEELAELREWEQSHGHRLPVLTLLDNRIAKLAADGSADSAYPADPQTGT